MRHAVDQYRNGAQSTRRLDPRDRAREGRIDDVTLSDDFTMLPKFAPGALELEAGAVKARVTEVYRSVGIQSPGVAPDDLTKAVLLLRQQ